MSSGTLARLNVLLTADSKGFEDAMKSVSEKMGEVGERMTSVGKELSTKVTAPIAAVGAALFTAAVRAGNMADALLDLEQQTGLSTVVLQEFRNVARIAGVEQDTVANATMNLTKRLGAMGEESEMLQAVLGGLGVQVRNADGSFRDMDLVMPDLITSLQGMENVTERNRIAQELFGRGAVALAPILGMTAEEFNNARLEAHALGLILEGDALEAANEFRIEFDKVKQQLGAVVTEIGIAVLPILQRLVQFFSQRVVPVLRRVATFIENLDPGMQMVIAGAAAIVAAIGPMLVIFGTVVKAAGLVAGALAAFNPVTVAVVAAIGAVVVAFVTLQQNWDRISAFFTTALADFRKRWEDLKDSVSTTLSNLGSNSLTIVQNMMTAILNVFASVLGRVKDTVTDAVDSVLGIFRRMSREAVGNSIIPDMLEMIEDHFDDMADWMPAKTEEATTLTLGEFSGMFDTLMGEAKKFLGDFDKEWGGLKNLIAKPFENLQSLKTDWVDFFKSFSTSIKDFWNAIKGFADKLTRFWEALTRVAQTGGGLNDPLPPPPGGGFGGGGFRNIDTRDFPGISASGSDGMGGGITISTLNIDARGTTDPDATGRSVARAFVEEIDRALGESTLRESRLDGMMLAL
jgi:hypothetical protein